MKILYRFFLVLSFTALLTSLSVAQWTETSGPYGGNVKALLVNGTNMLAGTHGGGVFLSTNSGSTWTSASSGLNTLNISYLAVYGTATFAATDSGVYVSTNNGANWTVTNSGLTNVSINCLALMNGNLYAGTAGGIFRFTNNGTSWSFSGLANVVVSSFAVSGSKLFAGTSGGGVFLSSDNGSSWLPKSSGLSDLNVSSLTVSGNNLFAGTDYNGGVFLSTDNGNTWTEVGQYPEGTGLPYNVGFRALAVIGTEIFVGTSSQGLYVSSDSGTTWTQVNGSVQGDQSHRGQTGNVGKTNQTTGVLECPYIDCLVASGTNLFAGTDGGLFLSTDNGGSWTETDAGISGTTVNGVYYNAGNLYAGDGYYGVSMSSDNGSTWSLSSSWTDLASSWVGASSPVSTDARCFVSNGNSLLVGTDNGVYLSTDGGQTWSQSGLSGKLVSSLAANISGTYIFAVASGYVYRSSDNGASWSSWLYSGLPYDWSSGNYAQVNCIAVSGTYLFAGTQDCGVWVSYDNGLDWTTTGMSSTDFSAWTITSFASMGGSLVAGLYSGGGGDVVFSSDNFSTRHGGNWYQFSEASPEAIAISGTNIFAATYGGGVFVSKDSGATWADVGSGLTNKIIFSLTANDQYLFAGTYGGGLWRRPLSEMITSVKGEPRATPSDFALEQNYPNPFNPSTVIRYQLPSSSHVKLKLYDILGRLVETLVDKPETAGDYSVEFNASRLPSGAYFYTLQAGTYHGTKKLLLLK